MSSETGHPPVIVVTGLPRSGTSLMMQMLAAAGVPILSDGARPPDEDNPQGYFELQAAKSIATDASWLTRASGQAVKIVVPLLRHVPPTLPCRVIWMQRSLDEVLSSQAAMLARSGGEAPPHDPVLRNAFDRQSQALRSELARRQTPTHFVAFRDAIEDPRRVANSACDFVGGTLDRRAAASTVEPGLYRQRLDTRPTFSDQPPSATDERHEPKTSGC